MNILETNKIVGTSSPELQTRKSEILSQKFTAWVSTFLTIEDFYKKQLQSLMIEIIEYFALVFVFQDGVSQTSDL